MNIPLFKDKNLYRTIRFRSDDSTYRFLKQYCFTFNCSMSDVIRKALYNYFADSDFAAICDVIDFHIDL